MNDTLISPEYAELNRRHHEKSIIFGSGGPLFVDLVKEVANKLQTQDILDYGCGKGELQKALGFPIWEYDPSVPGKDVLPKSAAIVVCASVLEHVEPDKLDAVLTDIWSLTIHCAIIIVPHNPAIDFLPDGSNAHKTVENVDWWSKKIGHYFTIDERRTYGSITSEDGHNMMIGSRTVFICH